MVVPQLGAPIVGRRIALAVAVSFAIGAAGMLATAGRSALLGSAAVPAPCPLVSKAAAAAALAAGSSTLAEASTSSVTQGYTDRTCTYTAGANEITLTIGDAPIAKFPLYHAPGSRFTHPSGLGLHGFDLSNTTHGEHSILVGFTKGAYYATVYTDFDVPFANVLTLARSYYAHL